MAADPARGGTLASIRQAAAPSCSAAPATSWCSSPSTPGTRAGARARGCCARPGPGTGSALARPRCAAERCPVGQRLVARLSLDGLTVTQETLLWDGEPRLEFRTHVDGSIGQDRLLRVSFPARRAGRAAGLPDRGRR